MKGIGRSLYYWGYTLEKNFLMIVGMLFFILVFMGFMDEDGVMATVMQMGPTYLIMAGMLIVFAQSLGNSTSTFSLTLSMGSTRKSTFISMLVMIHVIVLQMVGLGILLAYFGAPDIMALIIEFFPSVLGAVFFVVGLGSGVTSVGMKFGQVWGVVFYLVAFFACFFGGFIGFRFVANAEMLFEFIKGPMFLLVGFAIDIVLGIVEYRIFRKYEVKAQ